eukprot:g1980.t1
MSRSSGDADYRKQMPELKRFMDKRLRISLNGDRTIVGQLRGFDAYLNLVVDEGVEVRSAHEKIPIGMIVIRGASVINIEALEHVASGPSQGFRF